MNHSFVLSTQRSANWCVDKSNIPPFLLAKFYWSTDRNSVYILAVTASSYKQLNCVVGTENVWTSKSKYLSDSVQKTFADPWFIQIVATGVIVFILHNQVF